MMPAAPRRLVAICLIVAIAAACAAAAETAAESPAPSAPDLIANAKKAIDSAGAIKAHATLEAFYPAHYTSSIDLIAAPSGDERAEITTTLRDNTYKSLEVISDGVLWTQSSTPEGELVTKIDLAGIRKSFAKEEHRPFVADAVLGTNALLDLSGLAVLVDFTDAEKTTLDSVPVYKLSGKLSRKFTEGKASMPVGASSWFASSVVYLDESFFPKRIELADETGAPMLTLMLTDVEKNVTVPEGTFSFSPPEDAQVVDRTEWAMSQLTGK